MWAPGSGPGGRQGRGRVRRGGGQALPPSPAPGSLGCRRRAAGGCNAGAVVGKRGPSSGGAASKLEEIKKFPYTMVHFST